MSLACPERHQSTRNFGGLRAAWTGLYELLVPTPMIKVGFFFLADESPAVVSVLARAGVCQLAEIPASLKDYLTPYFPDQFRASYRRLRDGYEPLAQHWRLSGKTTLSAIEPRVPSPAEMDSVRERLEQLQGQITVLTQQVKQFHEQQAALEHLDQYVCTLARLDIDVRALADLRFLHLRLGTVPVENVVRLRESAALGEDLVLSLGSRRDRAYVLVLGAGGISADLDGLLAKAHFVALDSSAAQLAHGTADLQQHVQAEAGAIRDTLRKLDEQERRLKESNAQLVQEAAGTLARGAVFVACEGALEGRAAVAFLSGWVPRDDLPALEQTLGRDAPGPVALVRECPVEGKGRPPSAVRVPALFRAGSVLVALYGPPSHDELNPTLVLAATTPLLFGMMFGDVGFGLLLAGAALAGQRWLRPWVAPLVSCGLGSTVFGFLYGSVLGVEYWLPPLWVRPMHEPFRLLAAALWVGVGLVFLTFFLKAASLLLQRSYHEALFSFHAAAGAFVYLGGVLACRAFYLKEKVPVFALILIGSGLSLSAVQVWKELREQGKSALAKLASEYFHGILTLLTNTFSFLRLAAFALAHAALFSTLFVLIETIPPTLLGWGFRILLLVVGSILILVLDALAVAVQTIRLGFYEGLARYYRGEGQRFSPLQFPRRI